MRVAYITLDEVNGDLVHGWAKKDGFQVYCPSASELGEPVEGIDAVVLDLDYIPAEARAAWLSRIRCDGIAGRVLVHGHNISDLEAKEFRRMGVQVRQGRLRRQILKLWLHDLRKEARKCPEATRRRARQPQRSRPWPRRREELRSAIPVIAHTGR